MFPVLLSLGPLTISTMGVFLALAFFVTGFIFWRKGREEHYAEEEMFDVFLLSIIWGLIWSRIGFVIFHFGSFGFNVLKWLDFSSYPGLLPFLGIVMALLFIASRAKKQKWDVFEILDFSVLAISIGFFLIWIGAFFDGTGYGNPTRLPWGIQFPSLFDRRHPVQLYGAVIYFLLFWFLGWAEQHYRMFLWYRDKKHSAQTGFLFCVFWMVYGLAGAAFALVSPPQMVVFGFPLDIPVRIILFFYGLLLLYTRTGRSLLPARKPKMTSGEEEAAPASSTPPTAS